MSPRTRHRIVHAGLLATAAVVLCGVFTLYLHPDFLVTLVDQVWACI